MNKEKLMTTFAKMGILIIAIAFTLANPAIAWSKSTNVSVVDNYNSPKMGNIYPQDYPNQTFSTLATSSLSASTLVNKDTLFLFAVNPGLFNNTQKSIINSWIYNGGKLIIWDSEEPSGTPGGWDYTWLPYPFSTSVPGATGAHGKGLWVIENNQLSSNLSVSPFFINTTILNNNTDAVGDANVFMTYSSSWCVNMKAKNTLNVEGPVHTYAFYGDGLIIYSGLDWDAAGSWSGWNWANSGIWLKKLFKQELEVSGGLQCGVVQPGTPNLVVTKTSDKTSYNISEAITFTINVTNNGTQIAYGVNLTDIPPNEISIAGPTTFAIGDLMPGASAIIGINAVAISPKLNVNNIANAAGRDIDDNIVAGNGIVTFSIDTISPAIIGNTPNGSNELVTTPITVTFNETMNQSSAQSAFSISPAAAGDFSWSGDTMIYTPGSNLSYNTTYTVDVGTGAMDLAGNSLQSPYSWQFTTSSAPDTSYPTIIGNTPTGSNESVTTPITVTFNETMNHSSAQSAFSTSPATTGDFSWSGDTMIYTPGSSLDYSTTYTVNIGTGAMDLAGNSLQSPYSWQFTTELLPAPTGTLTGKVISGINGSFIEGALVRLNNGYNTTSSADGTYTVNSVPIGTYFITTTHTGYPANITSINLTQGINVKDIVLGECRNVFSDVSCSYWGYQYIMALYDNKVTTGYPDNTFRPENNITRAEQATFIVKAMNFTYTGGLTDFPDVGPTHWAYQSVMAGKQNGVITGYPDGTFKPDNQVTRAEISVMVTKSRNWVYSGSGVDFIDVPPTLWSYPYIMAIKEKGVIGGYPDGTFKPDNRATRVESSVMITDMMLWY